MPGEIRNYICLKTIFSLFNISDALGNKNPPQPLITLTVNVVHKRFKNFKAI